MQLSDLFSNNAFESVLVERRAHYFEVAEAMLHSAFLPAIGHLEAQDLRVLVEDCFHEAARFGVMSERDHLRYLTARMFMGRNFLSNPLYRNSIQNADLLLASGKLYLGGDGMRHVLAWVDQSALCHAEDLFSVGRLIRCFESIYRSKHTSLTFAELHAKICEMWPATMDAVDDNTFIEFAKPIYEAVISAGADSCDALAVVGLGVHFGHDLLQDPRLPWLRDALMATDKSMVMRRKIALDGLDCQLEAHQGGL